MKYLLVSFMALCLCACASSTVSKDHLFIKDRDGKKSFVGLFATGAQHRVVIVNAEGKFCAEPSPDAVDDLVSQVTASLEASAKSGSRELEAAANAARTIVSDAKFLIERTQGLQYFRDGSFSLCILHANGAITSEEALIERHEKLLEKSTELILEELPLMAQKRLEYLEESHAKRQLETRLDEIKKIQEVLKPAGSDPDEPPSGETK
jgi:hypothetical protein